MNGPKVRLMELREYRSERTGNTYFSGFLGKAKVVILRDDRAECTGKEVARWNVLLEEQEPREDMRSPRKRRNFHLPEGGASAEVNGSRAGRTAADRRAEGVVREMGIDPESDMSRDDLPF